MKKTLFLLLALLLVGSGFAQKAPQAKLISSSEESIVVNFQLNGFSTNRVVTPQGEQFVVNVPKMAAMLEAGCPDLPSFPIPTIIGDRAEMTINVIDAKYTDYTNMSIAPSKGNISRQVNPNDVPYTYGAMYQENAFWPAAQAYLDKPYILRDFRGQNIVVRPFAYNPVTHTLRVYESLTLEMTKVSDNGENPKGSRKSSEIKVSPEIKASYSHRFINFGATATDYTFQEDFGEMLVICADQFMAGMQPFVDWKNQSGRPTTMVSMTEVGGNNTDVIKQYITNFYNDPNHNLVYVLFVGDYEHITPHEFTQTCLTPHSSERSDNWFVQLEGNDHYTEAFIGRFSVQTDAHVASQVNKVLYYERDLQGDITWGDKGMGIGYYGAGSGHYGEDDYQHIDFIRDTLLHYTYSVVTEHHGGSGGDATPTTISGTINEGISVINYCNHGNETSWGVADYNTSHVNTLTNDYKWPVVWSVACLNGRFNYSPECFGEAWMRATDNTTGVPTGAIGGMFSWMSQPWTPPMYGQDEMVNILTGWHGTDQYNHTLAGASLNGNTYVIDMNSGVSGTDTHDAWILFGDPSLMVRTANPTELNVSLNPAALMIGMNSLEVTADAEYGIATLSNEEGVLASAKLVNGTATLEFAPLNAVETLTLVVIGYNKVTEMIPLEVLPAEGAFISVDAYTPGNVPVNQEQTMSMTFKNIGVDPTPGTTTLMLSSEDPNITFTDNEGSFGVLAANETITLTDEFAFTVAPGVADGSRIQIDVTATCGSEVWTGKAKITVCAPVIAFDGFTGPAGFEPGTTVTIAANFKNNGHYMATNTIVTASSQSQYVTFESETAELGTIEVDGSSSAVFTLTIDEACPLTETIGLDFALVADNEVEATGSGLIKNSCLVVFNLQDSYGDGWNNAKLNVAFSDGTPTMHLTFTSGNQYTETVEITTGVHVTLTWTSGNYDYECSFTVSYEDGGQITSGSNLNSSYNFEFDVNCSDGAPAAFEPIHNLNATVEGNTVTLTWEAPEEITPIGYVISRNGIEIAYLEDTELTYVDEQLEWGTSYNYAVVARYRAGYSLPMTVAVTTEMDALDEHELRFSIYPNPANGNLFIKGGEAEYSYIMINGMGQQVAKGIAKGTETINVSDMSKGIYTLRITTGEKVVTEKVVVK